ncbi:ABC transporter permease [Solibacillus sp. MA9]|uniref:ABC transporter permease n=1 Tax=Solibacillus palustris TaxID=2908203 RepID=A0ABS9U8H0_9BACL|nr:ABC transporter permease [Solibacillus sp. MA9]MCH7320469.1 ABC transporter permease [Solibacillus sp. MA9]
MNVSLKRIQAIFMKDYKEFSRNYAISMVIFLPLILALMYRQTGAESIQSYFLPLNMTFSMVTAYVQSCLIAEEKERNTLRSLMMSPASIADILLGKSLLVFILTGVILAVSAYIVGYAPSQVVPIVLVLAISTVFYLAVGTICGLFTKSVMEASLAVLPIILVFSFGPMALNLTETNVMYKIAQWLPSAQLVILAEHSQQGASVGEIVQPLLLITIWTVVAIVIAVLLFKKRTKDE